MLDLILLDPNSLKYKYSELAAAIIFCSFDPSSLIEKITGMCVCVLMAVLIVFNFSIRYRLRPRSNRTHREVRSTVRGSVSEVRRRSDLNPTLL